MSPIGMAWLQTVGVVLLAGLGAAAGWRCSKLRGYWWLVGYVTPLSIMAAISLSRWFPRLESAPPFAWIMAGRVEFVLMAAACAMMMTSLVSRLRRRGEKVCLMALMVVFVAGQSIPSFLAPAFNYHYLRDLKTLVDVDGVCIQSNGYTCGPAAAVTALHQIGVEAREGDIAVWAHTTRMTGTQTDVLCDVIATHYGVPCRQAYFRTADEMRDLVPVIAVVKYAFLIDHFVTVLEVTDSAVVVGDPLEGRVEMTRDDFAKRWRRNGIVLERTIAIE